MVTEQDDRPRITPLDLSALNADLAADLAKAQGAAETVGKDGTNTQNRYKYATAEAMIRGSRKVLSAHGLSLIVTWEAEPVDSQPGDIGNQFVGAVVTAHWALMHKSGGAIRGTSVMDAICSRARPTDKAVAATLTYMHGFILRGLLNLDRDEEDEHAVDKRQETDFAGRRPQQAQTNNRAKPDKHQRGDNRDWQQWTEEPKEVRAKGEPDVWHLQAAKGLMHHCGVSGVAQARVLLRWLCGEPAPEPDIVKTDKAVAYDVWRKLIGAHVELDLPYTSMLAEAHKAAEQTEWRA